MESWREWTLRVTIVLLATSVVLIGPGVAGIGSSLPFLGALVVLTAVCGVLRSRLAELPRVVGHNLGTYGQDLWLGPLVGLVVVGAIAPSASAAELQALGGIAGLVGMVNYFIRPLYFVVVSLLWEIAVASNSESAEAETTPHAPRANGDRSAEMTTPRESVSTAEGQVSAPGSSSTTEGSSRQRDGGATQNTQQTSQGPNREATDETPQGHGHEQSEGTDGSH